MGLDSSFQFGKSAAQVGAQVICALVLGDDAEHLLQVGDLFLIRFCLPEELLEIVSRPPFHFVKKDSLALSAVAEMAYGVVANSFAKHGKLVVQSSMPDLEGILYTSTAGSLLGEHFQIIGLGSYLQVIPNPLSDTERSLLEKAAKPAK